MTYIIYVLYQSKRLFRLFFFMRLLNALARSATRNDLRFNGYVDRTKQERAKTRRCRRVIERKNTQQLVRRSADDSIYI